MGYRPYDPHAPLLIGYDPVRDLPPDHLARFIDQLVDEVVVVVDRRGPGQPGYDPRLGIKVVIYGYSTGVRSSRLLEQNCRENLAYRFLTGGEVPSYRSLCTVRKEQAKVLEMVWLGLFATGKELGLKRVGKIVIDATKMRANASPEAVLKAEEYEAVRQELERILAEAEDVDAREDAEEHPGKTRLERQPERVHMRDIVRRVRRELAKQRRQKAAGESACGEAPADEEGERSGEPQERQASAGQQRKARGGLVLPLEGVEDEGWNGEGGGPAEQDRHESAAEEEGLTPQMRERVEAAVEAIKEAVEEGRKHVCLTDPDARMMPEGREKKVRECHSLEGAVDKGDGLLVAAGTSQEACDNSRTADIVAEAQKHEEVPITEVDGDSGMFNSAVVARLEEAGVNTCIPDSNTACDLHRGQPVGTTLAKNRPSHEFIYDEATDSFRCPAGGILCLSQTRRESGQDVKVYKAVGDCRACPMAGKCLQQKNAKRRTVYVKEYGEAVRQVLERFDDPVHRQRYGQRGRWIETVWGFLRGVLGYDRWLLRGNEGVAAEGVLLKLAYQVRKVHPTWRAARTSS